MEMVRFVVDKVVIEQVFLIVFQFPPLSIIPPMLLAFVHYRKVSHLKTLNCMLQAGPPSLHYYYFVVLYSCIVLPPVGHSSNHEYHCCQLTDNRAVFRIFIALLRFTFDTLS